MRASNSLIKRLYYVALALAGIAAACRIGRGLYRLLFPSHVWDGFDLGRRWEEVHAWFAGLPVYGAIKSADYPPGSYPMFWLAIGWTDLATARWIWAALTLVLLGWFVWMLAKETTETPGPLRSAALLFPLLGYATYSTIVNGQVSILVVTALLGGVLILARANTWKSDLLGSGLVALSLIKPTLSVPVVWVAFLKPQRIRPMLLIVSIYIALSLLAFSFQPVGPLDLIRGWLDQSGTVTMSAAAFNLQKLLASAGLSQLFVPVGLGVGLLTGAWVFRYRNVDVWLLLGVTSIVATFWTYHRPYDDLLMLLPAVALIRVACSTQDSRERTFAAVLGLALIVMSLEHPQLMRRNRTHGLLIIDVRSAVFALDNLRVAIWLSTFAFLLRHTQRSAFPRVTDAAPVRSNARAPTLSMPGDADQWIVIGLALPVLTVIAAFTSLAIEGRELAVSVQNFLRGTLPNIVAAGFVTSCGVVYAGPRRSNVLLPRVALAVAAALIALAVGQVSLHHGTGEALRNLSQFYLVDGQSAFGSHWRAQVLSTLWLGLAAPLAAWAGYRWLGWAVPGESSRALTSVAWATFTVLTIAFGLRLDSFLEPSLLRYQACELIVHSALTIPLGFALLALHNRSSVNQPAISTLNPSVPHMASAIAIPLFIALALLARSGTDGATAAAPSIAAHITGRLPDFLLFGLFVVGLQTFASRTRGA